jgi:hypothetical protein
MTKKEAFVSLTSERGWYYKIGITEKAASSAKQAFKNGKLSSDKIDELLMKAGFEIIQEELWKSN